MKKLLIILGVILGLTLAFSNGKFLRALEEESSSSESSISEFSSSSEESSEISYLSTEESEEESEGLRRLLKGRRGKKHPKRDRDAEEKPHRDGESRPFRDGETRPKLRKCKHSLRRIFRACKKDPQSKKCSLEKLKGKCLEIGCKVAEKLEISFPQCQEEEI